MDPLQTMAWSYQQLISALNDTQRLLELINTEPSINDAENVSALKPCPGRVDFHKVAFSYNANKSTLKGVSFAALPGKTIALVGQSGGGKSTMLKLICRFYEVTDWSITTDGQDIRSVTLNSLRDCLGVVPQEPVLFNQPIRDNVRNAKLDATDGEIEEVCKAAAIHDKILTFPDGYRTKVGKRGVKLSGGELQHVAIAPVLLKNPRSIMLDEATGAVDTLTEAHI